jgi:hypothetical protein
MPDERIDGKPLTVVAPEQLNKSDHQRLERGWPATGVVAGVDGSLSVLGSVGWAVNRPVPNSRQHDDAYGQSASSDHRTDVLPAAATPAAVTRAVVNK